MKPTSPPVGRIYDDGLSTEELRALISVEGADVSAGSVDEIRANQVKRIDEIVARKHNT